MQLAHDGVGVVLLPVDGKLAVSHTGEAQANSTTAVWRVGVYEFLDAFMSPEIGEAILDGIYDSPERRN